MDYKQIKDLAGEDHSEEHSEPRRKLEQIFFFPFSAMCSIFVAC